MQDLSPSQSSILLVNTSPESNARLEKEPLHKQLGWDEVEVQRKRRGRAVDFSIT